MTILMNKTMTTKMTTASAGVRFAWSDVTI